MKYIFDNSNLNESYAGVTTPLTFSFARRVYRSVYIQFCLFMGVSEQVIATHADLFPNMLAYMGGRMYYNLTNWHRMISFFPGYKLNGPFLEEMLGIDKKHRGTVQLELSSWQTLSEWWRVLSLLLQMTTIFVAMRWFVWWFNWRFNQEYQQLLSLDLSKLSLVELQRMYLRAETQMTKNFRVPIANDFAVMISVGLLKRLAQKWLHDVDEQLATQLIAGHVGIKSAEPGKALFAIIQQVKHDAQLFRLYQNTEVLQILNSLKSDSLYAEHYQHLQKYIEEFGFRVPGELKLESLSFQVEPELLIQIIKGQIHTQVHSLNTQLSNSSVVNLISKLPLHKKILFHFIWRWAQTSITIREDTRFKRTLIFALARQFFLAMANRAVQQELLTEIKDIFYLTVEEVCHIQKYPAQVLKRKILLRKNFINQSKKSVTTSRVESEMLPVAQKIYMVNRNKQEVRKKTRLQGRVACMGGHQRVSGQVVVMSQFDASVNLSGKVLVAAQTDPGWTVVFPTLKALIVERGGLLSHASIVAREFNIPCVINCQEATTTIKTGDTITIDLQTGIIT